MVLIAGYRYEKRRETGQSPSIKPNPIFLTYLPHCPFLSNLKHIYLFYHMKLNLVCERNYRDA